MEFSDLWITEIHCLMNWLSVLSSHFFSYLASLFFQQLDGLGKFKAPVENTDGQPILPRVTIVWRKWKWPSPCFMPYSSVLFIQQLLREYLIQFKLSCLFLVE